MKSMIIFFLLISTLYAGIGKVTALKGGVSLTRKGFSHSVKIGLELLRKDLISTKERSKAQVILNDDTVITIGPNSSYHFLEYAEKKDPEVLMQIDHGFFKAVTGKIGKIAPQRFRIKTRAATIGVRGTQFMAHVETDSEQIACVYGTIVVTTFDKVFVVASGKMLVYQSGEWYIQAIDYHQFTPVTLADNPLAEDTRTSYFINVNADETTEEQQLKQRAAPEQTPENPVEAFETSLDTDTPTSEPFIMEDSLSIPSVTTLNPYEINSVIDDVTPPPSFLIIDEVSVPVLIPLPDTYEINSAFDNSIPPPSFNP